MQAIIFTDVTGSGYLKYAGPFRIASELRSNGFTVQVIDYFTQWSTEQLKDIIAKFVTDQTLWVGFSTTFNSRLRNRFARVDKTVNPTMDILSYCSGRDDMPELISYIKEKNPKTKIVAGGHQANKLSLEKLIDHVVVGQGETTVVHLTKSLSRNESLPKYLDDNAFPFEKFNTSVINYVPEDIIFQGEHLPIEFSRGCVFKCKFCDYDLLGKSLWDFCKPAQLVANEMQRNYDLFKTQGYLVTDDTINDSEEKIEQLHAALTKLPFSLTLSSYARLDLLISKPHTLDLLYEMGFRNFFFGIETFNHEAGKAIGKGMHPDKLKAGLEDIKKRYPDFIIAAGIIFGLPYETEESMLNTIEYLKSSPIDNVLINPCVLTSDCTIGKNPEKYQYKINAPLDWKSAWTTSERVIKLGRLADATLKPRNKVSFTFLSRMMNLGYSHESLINTLVSQVVFDADIRKDKLRAEYFQQLMNS